MTAGVPDRILRIKTVLERTGLSRSTLYRKIREGTFPRQVKISAQCAGWRESIVNSWIAELPGDKQSSAADTAH
ncbi:helix-turn-helix transcriptional regulator [Sphingomonas mali]|uniref:helix-turn-helix transcriptional regulator n=1 Tax=Sphingomonas mali TaxID=40682 RepID=UPI000834FFB9|nr:AlpA family phage regulatory protein [Sphingomonas mali]